MPSNGTGLDADFKEEENVSFSAPDKSTGSSESLKEAKEEILYIGMDLGTSKSSIAASNGIRKSILSVVGWPKDAVSRRYLRQDILFGEKALEKRHSLTLSHPFQSGVIKANDTEAIKAAFAIASHLIKMVEQPGMKKYIAISVPSECSNENKVFFKKIAKDLADGVMILSEPFSVAYGLGYLDDALVVDIGAGTINFCRMHGSFPESSDLKTLYRAGDHIDMELLKLLKEKYVEARFTEYMVKKYKEEFGFVREMRRSVKTHVPVNGVPSEIDITQEMQKACESIIMDLLSTLRELIASFDPDHQDKLRKNILIAGGCSQIRGIERAVEDFLQSMGGGRVSLVDDPVYAEAEGSLKVALEMPEDLWEFS